MIISIATVLGFKPMLGVGHYLRAKISIITQKIEEAGGHLESNEIDLNRYDDISEATKIMKNCKDNALGFEMVFVRDRLDMG